MKKPMPTTVKDAEKSLSQTTSKESESEQLANQLLTETKIEPKAVPELAEKRKRGRPPKPQPKAKPVWNKKAYAENPIAEALNKTLSTVFNRTITKDNPIKPEEIELGEALAYTIDYYVESIPVTHPVFVVVVAVIGLIFTVTEKRKKPEPEKTEEEINYKGELPP